jgi:WD40 repeat protein
MIRKINEITGHSAAIYCSLAQGNFIYTGSADRYVARWLAEEGTQDKFAIRFTESVYALATMAEKYLWVGLANGNLHVFDLEGREEIKFFTQHTTGIFSLHYDPHCAYLFAADAAGNVSVWNADLELVIYLPLDCGKIRRMDSSADGRYLALGGQDGFLRIFETENFNEIHRIFAHTDGLCSLRFDRAYPETIYTGGKDARLRKWNWKEERCEAAVIAHTFPIYDILLDDHYLVSCSRDKHVKVWNLEDLSIVKRIDSKEGGHRHSVNSLAWIKPRTFASVSDDKRILIFQIQD